ncbi:MAG: hypothetical protein R2851_05355 [Caldilineaceae bacterium]
MDLFDPVLDRALSVDYDELAPEMRNRLGNGELFFAVDGATDLHDLFWPWADAVYARHIRMRLTDLYDDEFSPLVTRFFPGFQETIIGTEGMIVSKRLMPPFKSSYDRAVLWILECQAEGDRLLRIDVHIDWGEPLSQRMVDGLLVAQENPQSAQGIYKQKNADSTRVFGNPQARPDHVDLDDPNGAHLVYHVLVNGQVEVPLLMTVSDVGEQVAWNGFLAQRDCARTFELSVKEWDALLQRGRLWTPYPPLNAVANSARIAATRRVQRFRTGTAAADRRVIRAAAGRHLYRSVAEPVQSHNLLALLAAWPSAARAHPHAGAAPPQRRAVRPGRRSAGDGGGVRAGAGLARHGDDDLLADHADLIAGRAQRAGAGACARRDRRGRAAVTHRVRRGDCPGATRRLVGRRRALGKRSRATRRPAPARAGPGRNSPFGRTTARRARRAGSGRAGRVGPGRGAGLRLVACGLKVCIAPPTDVSAWRRRPSHSSRGGRWSMCPTPTAG